MQVSTPFCLSRPGATTSQRSELANGVSIAANLCLAAAEAAAFPAGASSRIRVIDCGLETPNAALPQARRCIPSI